METEKNLLRAIAGESMARNKYTFFASQAHKDGYEQIAAIFEETAENEKEHAKRLMTQLKGDERSELVGYDFPKVEDTKNNLVHAAAGEKYEWTDMYPSFEKTAREEGMNDIADIFKELGEVEEKHEARYLKFVENIEKNQVFKRDSAVRWHCRNCGYVHEGTDAPDLCPACAHPQSFYELLAENY